MPAVGITDWPWCVALECRSAWLVVDTRVI